MVGKHCWAFCLGRGGFIEPEPHKTAFLFGTTRLHNHKQFLSLATLLLPLLEKPFRKALGLRERKRMAKGVEQDGGPPFPSFSLAWAGWKGFSTRKQDHIGSGLCGNQSSYSCRTPCPRRSVLVKTASCLFNKDGSPAFLVDQYVKPQTKMIYARPTTRRFLSGFLRRKKTYKGMRRLWEIFGSF